MTTRRLYRSRKERMIWGVAGGLAEYLDIDPVLVRIGFVLLTFANGVGLLLYVLMAIVVPSEERIASAETAGDGVAEPKNMAHGPDRETEGFSERTQRRRRNVMGAFLIAVGVYILLGNVGFFSWFQWQRFWPLLVIALGVAILLGSVQRRAT